MGRLPHFDLRHPIKNVAGIEIAKNTAFEFQQQGRMDGVAQIQQRVGTGQSAQQIGTANSETMHLVEIMRIIRARLIEQTISFRQSMDPKLCLKTSDCSLVGLLISGSRKNLEPNCIEL